jgi:hypothetical protein
MRKTTLRKFSAGIYHTILKKAKSTFVPGLPTFPNEQEDFDHFADSSCCQVLRLASSRPGERILSI